MPDLLKQDYPTVKRPYRCPCGNNQFYVEAEKPPHGHHLRCTNCERGGFWMEKPKPPPRPPVNELDYPEWIFENRPPDLQELVRQYGGRYSSITPEAWAEWDRSVDAWEAARRDRLLGSHTWALREIKPRKLKQSRPKGQPHGLRDP